MRYIIKFNTSYIFFKFPMKKIEMERVQSTFEVSLNFEKLFLTVFFLISYINWIPRLCIMAK